MGRYSSNPSYGHKIQRMGHDFYRLWWTCDRYYANSRLRFPKGYSRDTDTKGAQRFAKRWGVAMPKDESARESQG